MIKKKFEFIDLDVSEAILTVSINRLPVNALNSALIKELNQLAEEIGDFSGEIRVVILTNEGNTFSAGADLKERHHMSESEVRQFILDIRDTFYQWYSLSVPTICAMCGGAFGGGLELALMCDFRILSEAAQVGFPETRLAIIPGSGGTQRLPRLIGETKALEWILTGKRFNPSKALNDGVVSEICPGNEVLQRARQFANEICAAAPIAVEQAKRAIKDGAKLDYSSALRFESECYNVTIPTEDRKEALLAFRYKRKPRWSGN